MLRSCAKQRRYSSTCFPYFLPAASPKDSALPLPATEKQYARVIPSKASIASIASIVKGGGSKARGSGRELHSKRDFRNFITT